MKVLALDTSTLMSTCAVMTRDKLLGEYSFNMNMSHSERLLPMIKIMLEELGIGIDEIDLFAVSTGPGSFTGLRIGVSTIKSFAHVLDKPVIGISTLKGLAYNLPYNKTIIPMIDARRDRIYTGIYGFEDGNIKEISEPDVVYIEDLAEYTKGQDQVLVVGNGSMEYKDDIREILGDRVLFSKTKDNDCRASSIAELALIEYEKGNLDDPYKLVPEYLRVSQAEREKGK